MTNLELLKKKILDYPALQTQLVRWQFQQKKIVFTNGCFDLIHLGHIDYLSKAKDLGDVLLVGLNTDASVRRLDKGASRPIKDEYSRAIILAAMHFIDGVVLFDEDTPYQLIKLVQPDVLVKGSDYRPEEIVGYDIVKNKGGEIVTIDFLPGYSTSLIEEKIKKA
jgi:rfaE bifunctional protein nucleotidyltransferase chain/domain